MYTEECCRKCKEEDFKLPVYIDGQPGIYVKLPQNIFRFSKVFKSFVKVTDPKKCSSVNNSGKANQSHNNAQGNNETSAVDSGDETEDESDDDTDFSNSSSNSYNSSEDDSTGDVY